MMVFCKLQMREVKRNTCLMCHVEGAPDQCEYVEEELKQTSLEGF